MRKIFLPIAVVAIALFFLTRLTAQPADSKLIKQAATNYVQGFYMADRQMIAKALSPELSKKIIIKDSTGDAVQNMGYSLLVFSAGKNKNTNGLNPNEPFKADVTIYDVGVNIATVKIVTNKFRFIDYAQLARINGEWKIVNVLWEFTQPAGH